MPIASLFALSLLASEPAAAAAAPGPAPQADTPTPTVAKPKYKGTGLLATSGLLGGTSLALTITRNVMLKKNCPLEGTAAAKCSYDFGSDIGLAATVWAVNLTNVGIAPGAGVMLARYHAHKDAETGRKRPIRTIMGAGGGVLGAGFVGLVGSVAMTFVLPKKCVEKELGGSDALAGDKCLLEAYPAWTMLNWASFSMIAAGAGMLAYGNAYKNSGGRTARAIHVSPMASRGQAGIALAGRF